MTFRTRLHLDLLSDKDYALLSPLEFKSTYGYIIVPKGFVTDFASVPRIPFVYLIFANRGKKAAVVHDYLYRTGWRTRYKADNVYMEALKDCGIEWYYRSLMYLAVRLRGNRHYNG